MERQQSIGAKVSEMPMDKYFSEIETIEFQVQYSIFSGFNLVLSAMSEDTTLAQLIGEMVDDEGQNKVAALYERIEYLLGNCMMDTEMSYDESVAAYLYCLTKADFSIAEKASQRILETGGLWWSVQLALHVIETVDTEVA